jgi:hypothetical protein
MLRHQVTRISNSFRTATAATCNMIATRLSCQRTPERRAKRTSSSPSWSGADDWAHPTLGAVCRRVEEAARPVLTLIAGEPDACVPLHKRLLPASAGLEHIGTLLLEGLEGHRTYATRLNCSNRAASRSRSGVVLLGPRRPNRRACDHLEALVEQRAVVEHQQPLGHMHAAVGVDPDKVVVEGRMTASRAMRSSVAIAQLSAADKTQAGDRSCRSGHLRRQPGVQPWHSVQRRTGGNHESVLGEP